MTFRVAPRHAVVRPRCTVSAAAPIDAPAWISVRDRAASTASIGDRLLVENRPWSLKRTSVSGLSRCPGGVRRRPRHVRLGVVLILIGRSSKLNDEGETHRRRDGFRRAMV